MLTEAQRDIIKATVPLLDPAILLDELTAEGDR